MICCCVQQGMDKLDLSFSDDAWFAVPDTACSTARGGVKSTKDQGFDVDVRFLYVAVLFVVVMYFLLCRGCLLSLRTAYQGHTAGCQRTPLELAVVHVLLH